MLDDDDFPVDENTYEDVVCDFDASVDGAYEADKDATRDFDTPQLEGIDWDAPYGSDEKPTAQE